jgi:two-component system chemotaxis response regulator CheB
VLLSGQLDDGSAGLMAVKMRDGLTIVQDPEEAAAPEMPSRAIQYADPEYVLPILQISKLLTTISGADVPVSSTEAPMPDKVENETSDARLEGNADTKIGKPSALACPDCHGVLWEMEEGQLLRFRCRVGHAYTADALNVAMSEAGEDALWVAMRALEEKAALLRRLASRSSARMGRQYLEEAAGFDVHSLTIRKMLAENYAPGNTKADISAAS